MNLEAEGMSLLIDVFLERKQTDGLDGLDSVELSQVRTGRSHVCISTDQLELEEMMSQDWRCNYCLEETMRVNCSVFYILSATSGAIAFNLQPTRVAKQRTNHVSPTVIPKSALQMADTPKEGFAAAASAEYETLGLQARPGRPLKVAIAGGGVGGLTCALCMLKKGFDVTVYEKTEAFQRFGGPIQFASNALSVLKEIDDTLFDRVMEKFTFTGTRTCGIKDGR
eukprot:scaffold4637_cov128-Cylindrotheca_fusiformis.AAC.15